MINPLTKDEIDREIRTLEGWTVLNAKLHRELEFADFVEAFAFLTKAAIISEKLDHHPEWFNVYNRVIIDLVTHDCKAISARDIAWARAVNAALTSKG